MTRLSKSTKIKSESLDEIHTFIFSMDDNNNNNFECDDNDRQLGTIIWRMSITKHCLLLQLLLLVLLIG